MKKNQLAVLKVNRVKGKLLLIIILAVFGTTLISIPGNTGTPAIPASLENVITEEVRILYRELPGDSGGFIDNSEKIIIGDYFLARAKEVQRSQYGF